MSVDLKGLKRQGECGPIGGILIWKGRCMTEEETRILVNYGLKNGYRLNSDVPEDIVDEICKSHGNAEWCDQYDEDPRLYTLDYIERIIHKVVAVHNLAVSAYNLCDYIRDEL